MAESLQSETNPGDTYLQNRESAAPTKAVQSEHPEDSAHSTDAEAACDFLFQGSHRLNSVSRNSPISVRHTRCQQRSPFWLKPRKLALLASPLPPHPWAVASEWRLLRKQANLEYSQVLLTT